MALILFFFGYQKWFQYEAEALTLHLTRLANFWMYPVSRHSGRHLGVAEWLFGGLLFLCFWNKKLGSSGALGSCFSFIFTIILFMPDGWAQSAGGFPAMTERIAFQMKHLVFLVLSLYLLKQAMVRAALSRTHLSASVMADSDVGRVSS